ncbi:MAG: hypothetical protein ACAH12_07890 [Methylophilaceae bacterium]
MKIALITTCLLLASTSALAVDSERATAEATYTLYRSSAMSGGSSSRIHIATFDAAEGAPYNSSNCETAKNLFMQKNSERSDYWCEQGYFSKR